MQYVMAFAALWYATMASISYVSAQYASWKGYEERAKTYLGNSFQWSILTLLALVVIGVWK